MVTTNHLKQALKDGQVAMGGWIQIGHPAIAEVLARAGLKWVVIDCEHGIIDLPTAGELMRAMRAEGCTPIVRLPINDSAWIARVLDAGAQGIIVPMVNTAQQAATAVASAKYPPTGKRGFGYCRANDYGSNFDAYAKSANEQITVIVQVEHIEGVRNMDAIAQVPGIDGIFVGPYDLSGSMGIVGQMDDPRMKDALNTISQTCKRYNIPAGLHVVQPEAARFHRAVADGFRIIAMSLDAVLLQRATERFLQECAAD